MKAEESNTRLSDFGSSRGKIVFRYNHHKVDRPDDNGDTHTCWRCHYVRVDDNARSTLIDAVISARYDRSEELAMINNKDLNADYAAEYAEYQAYRSWAKNAVDTALAQ